MCKLDPSYHAAPTQLLTSTQPYTPNQTHSWSCRKRDKEKDRKKDKEVDRERSRERSARRDKDSKRSDSRDRRRRSRCAQSSGHPQLLWYALPGVWCAETTSPCAAHACAEHSVVRC